ncbi:unnamed protein product, partial [Ectocarpus sp. 12 AP-2014]
MTAQVRHLCGNSSGINPDHLGNSTIISNHADKVVHGTATIGERNHLANITEEEASLIEASKLCAGEEGFETQGERAERFFVSLNTVNDIDNGRTW